MNPVASARNVEKLCPREKFENVRVVVNGKVFGVGAADEQGRFVEGHDGLELVDAVLVRNLDLGVEETILRMVVVSALKF